MTKKKTFHLIYNYEQSKKALRNISIDIDLLDIARRTKAGFNQPVEVVFQNEENIITIKNNFLKSKDFLEQFIDFNYLMKIIENIKDYKCYENILNIYVLSKWHSLSCKK